MCLRVVSACRTPENDRRSRIVTKSYGWRHDLGRGRTRVFGEPSTASDAPHGTAIPTASLDDSRLVSEFPNTTACYRIIGKSINAKNNRMGVYAPKNAFHPNTTSLNHFLFQFVTVVVVVITIRSPHPASQMRIGRHPAWRHLTCIASPETCVRAFVDVRPPSLFFQTIWKV